MPDNMSTARGAKITREHLEALIKNVDRLEERITKLSNGKPTYKKETLAEILIRNEVDFPDIAELDSALNIVAWANHAITTALTRLTEDVEDEEIEKSKKIEFARMVKTLLSFDVVFMQLGHTLNIMFEAMLNRKTGRALDA